MVSRSLFIHRLVMADFLPDARVMGDESAYAFKRPDAGRVARWPADRSGARRASAGQRENEAIHAEGGDREVDHRRVVGEAVAEPCVSGVVLSRPSLTALVQAAGVDGTGADGKQRAGVARPKRSWWPAVS
ncbi:hypothetical protein QFZ82_001251 [Streptomyces sp. V4I23]|nr:hypothetical protein [Streptomyces sp. V4I23]